MNKKCIMKNKFQIGDFDMLNKGFEKLLHKSDEFLEITKAIENKINPINISGVSEAVASHFAFSVAQKTKSSSILVTADGVTARRLYEDMKFFNSDCMLYLDRELIFYDIEVAGNDVLSNRLQTIEYMLSNDNFMIITTISALLSVTAEFDMFNGMKISFTEGEDVCENLEEKFNVLGYKREEIVEGQGQYCIRGGIIDFYPFNSDLPYRIELFDTEVDTVRTFDPISQRTIERTNNVVVIPASEYIITADNKEKIIEKLNKLCNTAVDKSQIVKDIEIFENSGVFPSIDKYIPVIYDGKLPTIMDYANKDTKFFFFEPFLISKSAQAMHTRIDETISSFIEKGKLPGIYGQWVYDYNDAISRIAKKSIIGMYDILTSCPDYNAVQNYKITSKEQISFHGKTEFFYDCVSRYKKAGFTVVILAGTDVKAHNLTDALNDINISSVYIEDMKNAPKVKEIVITKGELNNGFEYPLIKLAVISDREIFGTVKKVRRKKANSNQERIKSFTDLNVGDYVVHQSHGIGIFSGIKTMTVEGATSDYLQIKFNGDDSLYVPANQLDVLFKYVGKEGVNLKLNKLGGTQWAQTKLRVRKNCAEMAEQLINLYAGRQKVRGIEFSPQGDMHTSFDATFPYEETDDQLEALSDVYKDMENSVPMDRLLCGDVGYGKTEIALRAAFKAAFDGYQVAYLVPTTILANQHYNTFAERMADFGINVGLLSRFRTKKQQEETVKKVNRGEIDVLIGTHRIIQKDIKFKKLGLLIIDEEQRFGVSHKERLKELKTNVDVLTLSATPIPRTLHMSMVGIRDMSVLENPPKDRYPVSTYVMEYNTDVIKEAIMREVSRGGQVYYLHNRTENIESTAQKISSFSPHIRVAYAHGKMSERELEKIMQQVIDKEIDVLVCTTIIETGLDIANANTIIVEDADRMGLSQLYQLRGRVGRSNRLAYAYLFYKPDKVLSEIANKRLRAIKDFTEFGSGFKIAMRDLEIRGAGNLIGAEQHGFMDSVGYDMYCKLLEEAVADVKGIELEERSETAVSLNISAFIPKDYIRGENYRIEMYKKISMIYSQEDAYDVYGEIEDRYGAVPQSVENLIEISLIRAIGSECGISEIKQKERNVVLVFDSQKKIDISLVARLIEEHKDLIMFSPTSNPYLTIRCKGENLIKNIKIVLHSFKTLKVEEK